MSARAEQQGKHPWPWPLLRGEKTPVEEPAGKKQPDL